MTTIKELREAFKRHATLPAVTMDFWTFRKLRALKVKNVGYKSWTEFFKFLTRDVNLEPTLHERVAFGTQQTMLRPWMRNYADNLVNIRYGDQAYVAYPEDYKQTTILDLVQKEPVTDDDPDFQRMQGPIINYKGYTVKNPPQSSAVIIGRGPSLFNHNHLELLAAAQKAGTYKGLVVASDGGFPVALEKGVHVDAVVCVDGDPIIKKWFNNPIVKQHGSGVKLIASVTIHHEAYLAARAANMPVYWFNPLFDDTRQNESWTKLQRLMSVTDKFIHGVPGLNSGGNSGACAWITAMEIFKRSPIALIGMDLGYPADTPLEQTQYYANMLKEAEGNPQILEKAYPKFYHPTFKTWSFADFVFSHYRLAMIELQQETALWYRLFGGTHNCSEQGTLFGPEITCEKFEKFLEDNKT